MQRGPGRVELGGGQHAQPRVLLQLGCTIGMNGIGRCDHGLMRLVSRWRADGSSHLCTAHIAVACKTVGWR